MRLLSPLYLALLATVSLSAQQLSSFVQTQSDDGVLAIQNRFAATAGYGDQFAVAYNSTDATAGTIVPTVHLINEDGSLGAATTFPEARGSSLASSANSPDRTKAWFFGGVNPAEGSGQVRDLGVIYGDGTEFTYGALDLGVNEFFRGGSATENHLYALTEISDGSSSAQQFTLIKLNTDLSLADSMAVPLQEGFSFDYMLADESDNYALLVFTGGSGTAKVLGVDMSTNEAIEITLPPFLEDCEGQPEQLVRRTGGLAGPGTSIFYLLTTCGRVVLVTGFINESVLLDGTISNPLPNLFGSALFPLNSSPGNSNILIASGNNYKKIVIANGVVTELESGEYGIGTFLDIRTAAYNANERILRVDNPTLGELDIITQGEPGNWQIQDAEPLPLPDPLNPSTVLYNPAPIGDDLFAVLVTDVLQPAEKLQRIDPLTGTVEAIIPEFANDGLSAPQLLDNGNYVVQRIVLNQATFNQDGSLLEFDEDGEVAELARWEFNSPFQAAIWQRLIKAPDGDLIAVTNSFSPIFDPRIEVRRYTQSGTEVYTTTLPDSVSASFVYATPEVDADGNLYVLAPTPSQQGYNILSLDPTGAVRYVTANRTDQRFNSGFQTFRLSINASGVPYVMAMIQDDAGRSQALLAEINPDDGSEVNGTFLAPELNTRALWGGFIPGTDSLVVHHSYFSTDGPDPAKPYNNRILFFDENLDLFYAQEVLSTAVTDRFLPEGVTVSQDHIYVTGSRFVPEFDDNFASVLGVNFSDLAIVLGTDDFANATNLKVFPNPSTGLVNLTWEDRQTGSYHLSVMNIAGQLMQNTSGSLFGGRNQLAVDLSAYPAGTYYLRLVTPTGATTQSVSKQ